MRYSMLAVVLSAIMFFSFGVNSPGVVFEIETTYHSGTEPRVESAEMSVEGEMLKMEILPGEDSDGNTGVRDEAIFRGDRKEMIYVDHERKSYMVMDKEALRAISSQIGNVQSEMEDVLKNLPEDVKKQMQEAMAKGGNMPGAGPMAPPPIQRDYKKTGQRGTKEGYPCVRYDVFNQRGAKVQELWVTDWDNITGGGEARDAFAGMVEFLEEMIDSFSKMGPGGNNPMGDFDSIYEELKEIDGFPVVTREFGEDGDLDSESVLRSARHRTLDPADFEPPSGYKRQSMGGF
ncbi:MAG: hypothetical protein AAF502_16745 [Bacteroidota bacterium]